MGRVSQWAVRRPVYALLTWVGIMAAVVVLGLSFGGDYNDNFELPDTESTTAQDLLADLSGRRRDGRRPRGPGRLEAGRRQGHRGRAAERP